MTKGMVVNERLKKTVYGEIRHTLCGMETTKSAFTAYTSVTLNASCTRKERDRSEEEERPFVKKQ